MVFSIPIITEFVIDIPVLVVLVLGDFGEKVSELNNEVDEISDVALKRLHVGGEQTLVHNRRHIVLMFGVEPE